MNLVAVNVAKNNGQILPNDNVTLPFGRSIISHRCIICKSVKSLIVITPPQAKFQVFINKGLIIQDASRCCKRHLNGSVFKDDDANRIKQISNTTVLSGTEIFNLLNNFRIIAKKRSLDFGLLEP